MFYVICYPGTKVPIGKDWATRGLSAEEVAERRANNPAITVGVLLGPASGVVDVECDGEEATAAYAKLLGTVLTPSWQSTRGRHYLYQYDERLANLPGVVKHEGMEFRLGQRQGNSVDRATIHRRWGSTGVDRIARTVRTGQTP